MGPTGLQKYWACVLGIVLLLGLNCKDKPMAPIYDNPLDSQNTDTAGNPFHLKATLSQGKVILTWNKLAMTSVKGYNIYRASGESPSSLPLGSIPTDFFRIGSTTKDSTRFIDVNVTKGYSYWYKVTAFGQGGVESSQTNVVPIKITTDPAIVINDDAQYAASRQVQLTIRVAETASRMRLSNYPDFSDGSWEKYATSKSWTLLSGKGTKWVYLQIKFPNDSLSNVSSDSIEPLPINPGIVIADSARYTPTREVNLTLSASGTNLRMKLSEDSSFTGVKWENYAASKKFVLSEAEGTKRVYAKFMNDFEIESTPIYTEVILDLTAPIARFTVTPDSGITSETTFNLDASSSSDNFARLEELRVRWDWENDGRFDTDWLADKMAHYVYGLGGGDKTIRLEVKDGAGWTATSTRKIFVNTRPLASFTWGQDSENPAIFTFDASASTDYEDGTAVELRWDFLNDTIWDTDWLATKVITHEFTNFGEVVVKLQVCDKNGLTNEARQQIFVTPKDMVYVPAGQFTMGSDPGEGDADEEPEHVVYLDAYFIDKYEVTNLQYAQFLSAGNGAHYHPLMKIADTGGGKFSPLPGYENHPVVFVTWQDAQAYATWAGKRLPTEAEWEKAARGSSDERTYPWGEGISGARANYNHSGDPYDDGTTPVGYFNGINSGTQDSPSPYGAYDLAGNVWEWLADWYGADYYKTSPTSNPLGPSTGTYKVIRGGSWYSEPARLRCAKRSYLQPGIRLDVVGFRCAK